MTGHDLGPFSAKWGPLDQCTRGPIFRPNLSTVRNWYQWDPTQNQRCCDSLEKHRKKHLAVTRLSRLAGHQNFWRENKLIKKLMVFKGQVPAKIVGQFGQAAWRVGSLFSAGDIGVGKSRLKPRENKSSLWGPTGQTERNSIKLIKKLQEKKMNI